MAKKQTESVSKRQVRKEELRKKERQQRFITLGVIGGIAVLLLAAIIVPSILRSANPVGEFVKITPQSYPNEQGKKLGDQNAAVKIDIFEDFQCSACQTYQERYESQVFQQIVSPGLASYEFHQYPFLDDNNVDKASDRAALASECAAEQNRFWDYKKILFVNRTGNPDQFSVARLTAFAKSLSLDVDQFETCLQSQKYLAELETGLNLGNELGVKGTPSVFVNGQEVSPGRVPTFDEIYNLVQQKLQGS